MRKNFTITLLIILISFRSFSQVPDWSTQIANIIYKNCSSCHREGYIAPFTLMSYDDAVANGYSIQTVVNAHIMPPWPPDPDYRHFANEAVLSQSDIDAINAWVDGGMPSGNLAMAPDPPAFSGSSSLQSIDQTIQIPAYTTQFNVDEYRYFVIHSDYTETKYLNAIEVIPGNWSVVHHVDIYYDLSNYSNQLDESDSLPGFNWDTGYPNLDYYVGGWSPGGNAIKLPTNWGVAVPPGVDFVLEIHYAPGNIGITDTTRVNFKFVTDTSQVRSVEVNTPIYDFPPTLVNFPLKILANETKTFNQLSQPMSTDMSFIALSPHMHLIGRSYKVWFETVDNDSVPLIDIPDWNFHWQMYYQFQYVQKIPEGARIHGQAFYDNTVNNPWNPNNPPITVKEGPYTTDEMLMTFMAFTEYQPGDEDILMDSSTIATSVNESIPRDFSISIYPNPAYNTLHVEATLSGTALQLQLVNGLGMVMKEIQVSKALNEHYATQIDISDLGPGVYFMKVQSGDDAVTKKIVKLD